MRIQILMFKKSRSMKDQDYINEIHKIDGKFSIIYNEKAFKGCSLLYKDKVEILSYGYSWQCVYDGLNSFIKEKTKLKEKEKQISYKKK